MLSTAPLAQLMSCLRSVRKLTNQLKHVQEIRLKCVTTMYYRPSRQRYLVNYLPARQRYLYVLSFLITTLILSIIFSTTSKYVSPEVQEFQQALQPSNIFERTRKCSQYMSRLRHLILPHDNNTSADYFS